MKKLITAALMAAVAMPMAAIPTAASAQSHRDHRGDRNDRHDRRNDSRDHRNDRRDYRNDRNHNWGSNDWRSNRDRNRSLYARGSWRAPFRYQSFRPGLRIGATFYSSRYRIADPWRYHLPRPGYNQAWVRHYNDLLLVDMRRGIVIRVIRGFYW